MDGTPLLSPNVPRFAPPRTHTRTPSRSPTRNRLADDILSDLSPATTLEAFTNPSGKLKASIEAATPSERAFGLRATVASKKIQEWVDELSGWPWQAEGGSLGFEMPSAKRRKLSIQDQDRGRRNSSGNMNGNGYNKEPEYIGSLLAAELEHYENRIDDITADMDDLNVEEIKRQVLDTHFSPRSRPSSSASNAPPLPSLLASYTRMDDFTAVVTTTVLQSLPNLSRLTRLMDVWNIRLTVLRKVPPLMLALDDAEVALRSGWATIRNPEKNQTSSTQQQEDQYLSRKTFEVMRDVLQDKVTTLGQDLDYMLDTLEGRQDTLPEAWLDRMETIENDYGSWVVSGDRKVREGEWARMAKARKEEDDARKLKEAEGSETARQKAEEGAQEVARRKALQDAEDAEAAGLKAEEKAREAAKLQALMEAQEAEAAETARRKAEEYDRAIASLRALREAEEAEAARVLLEQQARAEAARLRAEEEVQEAARQQSLRDAEEDMRLLAEQQAQAKAAGLEAKEDARELAKQALRDPEAEASELKANREALEPNKNQALKEAEAVGLIAQREAEKAAKRHAGPAELARVQAERDAESARQKTKQDARLSKLRRQEQEAEASRETALLVAEALHVSKRKAVQEKYTRVQTQQEPEAAAHLRPLKDSQDAETTLQTEQNAESARTKPKQQIIAAKSAEYMKHPPSEPAEPGPLRQADTDCDICAELKQTEVTSPPPSSPSNMGAAASSGAVRTSFVGSLITTNFDDANPQISQYAPFDGGYTEASEAAIRQTEVEIFGKNPLSLGLASPIHLDDSFPQTPTSSTVSSTARVFTSPTSQDSTSPPSSKVPPFGHTFASLVRVSSPPYPEQQSPALSSPRKAEQVDQVMKTATLIAPQTPVRSEYSLDGANDCAQSEVQWSTDRDMTVVDFPEDSDTKYGQNKDVLEHQSDFESLPSRTSVALGYSTSEFAREIYEAQGAECCAVSPVKNYPSVVDTESSALSESSCLTPNTLTTAKEGQLSDNAITPTKDPSNMAQSSDNESNSVLSPVAEEMSRSTEDQNIDGSCEGCEIAARELASNANDLPNLPRKSSISRINITVRSISIPRRESISSDASTVINGRVGGSPSSPIASPISEDATESYPEDKEQSPSAGRIGHRSVKSYDMSPPGSPQGVSKRPSIYLHKSPTLSPLESKAPLTPMTSITTPSTPLEAPVFGNVDVSTIPILNSPKKANSDEQMQQQISSLLESIPARIRLTSDPDGSPFSSQTLRPKKTRRSITPSFRSSSSMSNYSTSSRAPTPSFTLAPAFGKTSSRPRPQSSNPEIKLYHLSRSTGEAPIKLFVRLVGENGERVMVRVGGGWADLGEYLKEYASHHGRRSALESGDKVEIQDLPSRTVSSSSASTVRSHGRSSPAPRPQSVLERERPGSSLFVRKSRKSVGESSSSDPVNIMRMSDVRSPSTPLPSALNRRSYETPPSAASSSSTGPSGRSSRLSWTEEDSSLGLAGPKSKKVTISERDQEWVESMKEKVRLASAEKEKRERERERIKEKGEQRKTSFGEMEKVGGTKRLFRKGI